ncbi:hypothetical protein HDZ31DRAFT_46166 [Schizophyllum fasciatum]
MSQPTPSISQIVRGIHLDLDAAPAVLREFDLRRAPTITVPAAHESHRIDYEEGLPSLGISYLCKAIAAHAVDAQLTYRIPVNVLQLSRRILSFECLAAIAFHWLAEESGQLTGLFKEQKRMAFKLIVFFHNLAVSSQGDCDQAFDAVFGLLLDQLADREDHREFGIDVVPDPIWHCDLVAQKRKRALISRDSSEEASLKRIKSRPGSQIAPADGRCGADFIDGHAPVKRRSVRYISPTLLHDPTVEGTSLAVISRDEAAEDSP